MTLSEVTIALTSLIIGFILSSGKTYVGSYLKKKAENRASKEDQLKTEEFQYTYKAEACKVFLSKLDEINGKTAEHIYKAITPVLTRWFEAQNFRTDTTEIVKEFNEKAIQLTSEIDQLIAKLYSEKNVVELFMEEEIEKKTDKLITEIIISKNQMIELLHKIPNSENLQEAMIIFNEYQKRGNPEDIIKAKKDLILAMKNSIINRN